MSSSCRAYLVHASNKLPIVMIFYSDLLHALNFNNMVPPLFVSKCRTGATVIIGIIQFG